MFIQKTFQEIKKISLANWLNQETNPKTLKKDIVSNNKILLIEVKPNTYLIKYSEFN